MELHAPGIFGAGMMLGMGLMFIAGVLWTEFLCTRVLWRLEREKGKARSALVVLGDKREAEKVSA